MAFDFFYLRNFCQNSIYTPQSNMSAIFRKIYSSEIKQAGLRCLTVSGPKCPDDEMSKSDPPKVEYFEDISSMPASLQAFKRKQQKFQQNDGLPIHLKSGISDNILLNLTCVLCGLGLFGFGKLVYDLNGGKEKQD